jgi:hypothetical protein
VAGANVGRREALMADQQEKDKDDQGDKDHQAIDLVIVINGQPFEVEAENKEALRAVVARALEQSNNTGQPPENWELRDETGKLLDLAKKVSDFHFADHTKLFLSLKAGIGG